MIAVILNSKKNGYMSILSCTNSGLIGIQNYIEQKLHITKYTYTILSDGTLIIDVLGDVVLFGLSIECLFPQHDSFVKFGNVNGNFICSYSAINSMKGFPNFVGGNLDISFSKIQSLINVPSFVDRHFVCAGLPFTETAIRQVCKINGNVYC